MQNSLLAMEAGTKRYSLKTLRQFKVYVSAFMKKSSIDYLDENYFTIKGRKRDLQLPYVALLS